METSGLFRGDICDPQMMNPDSSSVDLFSHHGVDMLGSVREYLHMYKIGSYEIHGPKRRIYTVFADLTFTDAPHLLEHNFVFDIRVPQEMNPDNFSHLLTLSSYHKVDMPLSLDIFTMTWIHRTCVFTSNGGFQT